MTIRQFLFVFDRKTGELDRFEYEDGDQEAMRKLLELEDEHRGDANTEIVLFSADSIEALRKTHPHYFNKERGTDSLSQLEEQVRKEREAS